MRKLKSIAGIVLLLALSASAAAQAPLRVAAAADLQFVLPKIAQQYENSTHQKLELIFGSSGNFYAQIQNGAPFDVFLSADTMYPQRLVRSGSAVADSYRLYAQGRLVLWLRSGNKSDVNGEGLRSLLSSSITRVAIANPGHAPYGRAAVAAMRSAGVYGSLQKKLVMGENIAQAAQFVQSGNAQAGLLAYSSAAALQKQSGGTIWMAPQTLYPPIEQAGVVLTRSTQQEAARNFLQYMASPVATGLLHEYGFALPPKDQKP